MCPVALTSATMKCLEKIVLKELLSTVSPHLDPKQFDYRAERSIEDVLLTLVNNIYEHLEGVSNLVKVMYVDFSSAFSTIQSHPLVNKLIKSKIILQLYDFLTNCSQ